MKEVQLKRFAGPFINIPFDSYIQSPIGLVPKDGGLKTRLIFHLSYPKNSQYSVNANTPQDLCKVNYQEFEEAVRLCLEAGKGCYAGKSDFSSAFRHLPINPEFWKFLVMKAKNPKDQVWYYFVDKCLPFGSSRSCALFQKFSDAISHVMTKLTGKRNVNYLDDYFFVALLKAMCNGQIDKFVQICKKIRFPISIDKTFYGSTRIVFLGLLIDTYRQIVCIPQDKLLTGKFIIDKALMKRSITLWQLQQICGFLNFLSKAIIPGRAFTRRMYTFGSGVRAKHLHIPMNHELKQNLKCWQFFLKQPQAFSRPFFEFDTYLRAEEVDLSSDASRNPELGAGGICGNEWFIFQWNEDFIKEKEPSIAYLELFAVTVIVLLWLKKFKNKTISLACDNQAVVYMVNSTSSNCKNCMFLIRLIVLECLIQNVKLTARYIRSKDNLFPDLLSRLKYREFRRISKKMGRKFTNAPAAMPDSLSDMEKLWIS